MDVDGRYYVDADGNRIETTLDENGKIQLGENATDDLIELVNYVNASGSTTAIEQIMEAAQNKTMIHVRVVAEVQDQPGQLGYGSFGLHQAHDKDGNPYSYVANNPISLVDPDGRQIKIGDKIYSYVENRNYNDYDESEREIYRAFDLLYTQPIMMVNTADEDSDPTFIEDAFLYLVKEPSFTVSIVQGDTDKKDEDGKYDKENSANQFKFMTNEIIWDPNKASIFALDGTKPIEEGNMGVFTPIKSLIHELFHAYNFNRNPDRYYKRLNHLGIEPVIAPSGFDISFKTHEERYTVKLTNRASDNFVGKKAKHRTNYGGRYFPVNIIYKW